MKVKGVFSMNRDAIKMLAMFTMLLNHIANALLPAGQPLTNLFLFIGYFTAVTMCYFLVEGYGYTRSKRNYAARLLVFAIGFRLLPSLPLRWSYWLQFACIHERSASPSGNPARLRCPSAQCSHV